MGFTVRRDPQGTPHLLARNLLGVACILFAVLGATVSTWWLWAVPALWAADRVLAWQTARQQRKGSHP